MNALQTGFIVVARDHVVPCLERFGFLARGWSQLTILARAKEVGEWGGSRCGCVCVCVWMVEEDAMKVKFGGLMPFAVSEY